MAAWSDAAAVELPAPPAKKPKPRRQRAAPGHRGEPRARIFGSALWIGFLAVLLAGVVALNVAVLRLNIQLDELGRERADLRAANAALASRYSSEHATARIQAFARNRLGLVAAEPADTTYVHLPPPGR